MASSFIVFISVLPSLFTEHVSAYMTFDVNPSIELELNDELEVLKLTGLNRDGELVIKEISNWKGKNVKIVTNRIVNTTKQLGYMEGKKQIVVSTTLLEDDKELDKNLKAEIKKVSKQENFAQTNLKVFPATKNDRDKAKEQGISTGKFVEEKLDKQSKEVKEQEKDTQVESSITSKENNSRQNEIPKNEIKKHAAEKQKVVNSLKGNEKVKEKNVQSHEQKQKVTMSKENEIKKVQKGKAPKHQRQKEKASRQQEQKAKQQKQKEKASRQQEQKQRQKERPPNHQRQKEKSPKQHHQKEKAPKHQVQKDEAAKEHPQRKNEPKQNPRGSQFDHKDIRNK